MARHIRKALPGFFKHGLRTKIIAWAFVPTAIILLAVALVNFYAYQQVTEELVIERDKDLTRLTAGQLANELTEYTDLLDTAARTIVTYPDNPAARRDALQALANPLAVFDGGVLLLDTFGTVVATEPDRPEILGQDWSDRYYYAEILREQIIGSPTPIFSDISADGPGGAEVVAATVPVIGDQGRFLGIFVGMFRIDASSVNAFYGDIIKLRIAESGSTYLLDGNGRVLYHSDADRIGEDFSPRPVAQQVLNGQTGAVRTRTAEGQDIVAAFAPVTGTSWGLVTQESWAALTGGSRGYQRFLLLLLALGVVVPALVVALGVRQLTRPIIQLIDAAQAVAEGNFGQTITAPTGDEIEELAEQFNQMSAQLAASYAHLEQRVADRTQELAALNAVANVVSRSLDLNQILDDALEKTLEVTGIQAGGIYLLQEDAGVATIAVSRGLSPGFVAGIDNLKVGEGFTGRVIQTGEPLIVRDLSVDQRLTRSVVQKRDFHSAAVVPLVSRGNVLGTLFVITRQYHEFPSQEIELLASIGHQVGVAVENARLFTQAEGRMRELEALYSADEQLYRHLDLDQVLQTLVEVAVDILQADKGSLMVWDAQQEKMVVRAARGFSPETVAQMSFAFGEGTVGHVVATGEPVIVGDVQSDPRVARHITEPEGIRSFMHVPIEIDGQIFGVFNVDYTQLRAFGHEEQRLFMALAQRAALAIENAQLYGHARQVAVFEERQRLARELHDAVTQTLFSASLIAEVLPRLWELNPDEGRHRVRELHELTRGALAEMRALLVELRPAALEEADLSDLLRQLADSITGRARVPVTLQVDSTCPLPPQIKVALYRIAQEVLNNVAKHSGASQATISLRCEHDAVELMVSDDGRGFDPRNVPPEHLGLGIMRERAEVIGATLEIASQIGQGTQVRVIWANHGQLPHAG
jgi:nitrate/nitrite-specific signal transduction histidine kinase